MNKQITVDDIDALLPQTQCGECSYAGCRPYAEAILLKGESIGRCPPGGVSGIQKLASLLEKNAALFYDELTKPHQPLLAKIREDQCIGCMKCIKACPVDAIIGTGKQMHSVLIEECTGCSLCVEPCPVDCIDMVPITSHTYSRDKARQRFQIRQQRLQQQEQGKITKQHQAAFLAKQHYVENAVARVKAKKIK